MGAKRKSFWYQGKHALSLLLVLGMILAMPPAIPAVADDRPDDACSGVGFLAESQQAAGESQDDPKEKKASGDTLVTVCAGETGKDTQEENDEEVTTCDAIEVEIENHAAGNLAVEIEAYLDAMGCPDASFSASRFPVANSIRPIRITCARHSGINAITWRMSIFQIPAWPMMRALKCGLAFLKAPPS